MCLSINPWTVRSNFVPIIRQCIAWLLLCAVLVLIGNDAFATTASQKSSVPHTIVVPGLAEPLVAIGPTTAEEDHALAQAVAAYHQPQDSTGDFATLSAPLTAFLDAHPNSAWNTAILMNMGDGFYHAGYFSRAIEAWEQAWRHGRDATRPQAKALVDRALGELARMHARLGHADRLEALFAEIGERAVSGPATETLTGAREALWTMRNDPGLAFLCGPKALQNLLVSLNARPERIGFLEQVRSGKHGFSLTGVAKLAQQAKLPYELVYREPGQPVPVPAIVHWKLQHYAAIVGEENGRFHIQDPTFASGDLWLTHDAIDAEASGYFLVPKSQTAHDWRMASAEEADQVYGMGLTSNNDPDATRPYDQKIHNCGDNAGMCGYNIHELAVSLNLTDTPVGYTPPVGPDMHVTLTYNQREAGQPAGFGYFNVSQKWTLNWLSYIQDSPASPGSAVRRYVSGGGSVQYFGYNSATGAFARELQGGARLFRIPATGPASRYELHMPNGSRQIFAYPDGATTSPRRLYLTQVVDASGNAATLNYDSQLRLTSITDATGRDMIFAYELAGSPLTITRITDPFGRAAQLSYDAQHRLSAITDVLGLVSSFEYDDSSLINRMTTPYGTSRFVRGGNESNYRWLEVTDPMGYTERVESRHQAPGVAYTDSPETVPTGMRTRNQWLFYRNTFYWDRFVHATQGVSDYNKARITHWLHGRSGYTAAVAESSRNLLEGRVWYDYPDQSSPASIGSLDKPTTIGRVLDDGTTQLMSATYNSQGNVTSRTDPAGRKTFFDYAANGIDVLTVRQKTALSENTVVARFTYNSQHLPLTVTDTAGQTTQYSYNAAGQLTALTNALGETTGYEYDDQGYLQYVVNANGAIAVSFTYDAFGRIASRTDSDGHTLEYQYDALDRITAVNYPDGTSENYAWDKLDLVSTTDRLGRMTRYSYDANRRLVGVTAPNGETTQYSYYPNGVLKSLTDANGNVTRWDVDLQSRPTAKRYADGSREVYGYESRTSRLASRTDTAGQVRRLSYTVDDRLASVSYQNAQSPTPGASFAYDAFFPRIVSMTDQQGSTQYAYHAPGVDGALQLATETSPDEYRIEYGYDALNRLQETTVVQPDGTRHADSLSYDPLGRVTSRATGVGVFGYRYTGESARLTEVLYPNQAKTGFGYYSPVGDLRLQDLAHLDPAGKVLNGHRYSYDPTGQISTWLRTGNEAVEESYGYDLKGQLLQVSAYSTAAMSKRGATPAQPATPGGKSQPATPAQPADSCKGGQVQPVTPAEPGGKGQRAQPATPPSCKISETATHYTYMYDPAGNRTLEDISDATRNSSYNNLNQLLSRDTDSFVHDAAGIIRQANRSKGTS